MKKVIFLCLALFFLCISLSFNVKATDNTYFEWIKTKIDIPLNANINNYKDNYVVKLYINGEQSYDFSVRYEVDNTTFSTVLTYQPGSYFVMYEAYNEYYSVYSKQMITFIVYDDESPQLTGDSFIRIPYGKTFNPKDYFIAIDNYDTNLEIKANLSNVNFNILGTYGAYVYVVDSSYNETKKYIDIEIYDDEFPTIEVIKPLFFSYGIPIDTDEFFIVHDNYDKNLHATIVEGPEEILGKSSVLVRATDSSNKVFEYRYPCTIIDDVSPTLVLKQHSDTIDIETVDNLDALFKSYIVEMKDNYTLQEKLSLMIRPSSSTIEVKDYVIDFILFDENDNETKDTLYLKLIETKGPTIKGDDVVEISVGADINLYDYIEVTDPFDSDVKDKVEIIDSKVDNTKAGIYPVYYRAYNSSGEYTIYRLNIIVSEPQNNINETGISNNNGIIGFVKTNIHFFILIGIEIFVFAALVLISFAIKKSRRHL